MLNVITQGSGALKNTFLSEFLKAREHPFLILVWEKGTTREGTRILLLRSKVSVKTQAGSTAVVQTALSHLQLQTSG